MPLTKKQLEKYADVLLWGLQTARQNRFKKNDIVLLRYECAAIKMAEILYAKLLDMQLNPIPRMGITPVMEQHFYKQSNNRQLVFQAPGEKELVSSIHGSIYLHAPDSLTHLSSIDPRKISKAIVARKPLRSILEKREEEGLFGWTLCTFPTSELARQAKLSLKAYTNQVIKACYLDMNNPVGEWKSIFQKAKAIKSWINSLNVLSYHIESANIDLRVTPGKHRQWIGISGHNIPSFELFLSPDWRGTEGYYYANQPSFRSGNYVEGVKIIFEKGSAVNVTAEKGEEFVRKQLAMDRGAGRLGELSLTDKRFSRIDKFMADTLYDENYGGRFGNCHIALGAAYSDTYAGNPAELTTHLKKKLGFNGSALHWDMVNTEDKIVTARLESGKDIIIYKDGIFTF